MHEICEENVRCIEDTATNKTILCLAANYSKTGTANALQNPEITFIAQDATMITTDQLRAKVCENNKLSPSQQEELFKVLSKYQRSCQSSVEFIVMKLTRNGLDCCQV
jgi:hypothetical protein